MKNKFIRNLKASVLSQFITIALGLIRATIIPFYLGVAEFGYWQIYILYVGLIGILSLGYIDGIYLNYGSCSEDELPLKKLRSSLLVYVAVLLAITLLLYFSVGLFWFDSLKESALFCVLPNIILIGFISYIYIVLQITNQIIVYSKYVIVDKIVFILGLPLLFYFGCFDFKALIALDIASRVLLLVLLLCNYKVYVFGVVDSLLCGTKEYLDNVNDGIKLMLANMASMIVLVVGRIYVEGNFSIEDFSVYSFGISITNLFLIAIGAVGVVLYPAIKRVDASRYKKIFHDMDIITGSVMFAGLLFYFPSYFFVLKYMPEYTNVLHYLNLLFLICALQGKMQIVLNTFYKVMRQERAMLKANVYTILLTLVLIKVSGIIFGTVYSVILSIALAMFYRVLSSGFYLRNKLGLKNKVLLLDVFFIVPFFLFTELLPIELSLVAFFILSSFFAIISYKQFKVRFINVG